MVATCLKKAEDGGDLILRLYECKGKNATATLSLGFEAKRIEETDLLERPIAGDTGMTIRLKPYEIKTFRIVSPSSAL